MRRAEHHLPSVLQGNVCGLALGSDKERFKRMFTLTVIPLFSSKCAAVTQDSVRWRQRTLQRVTFFRRVMTNWRVGASAVATEVLWARGRQEIPDPAADRVSKAQRGPRPDLT
jgi:hypothetical protein